MSATKLFAAGFTDLVSVIPPGARISEKSSIKTKQLGKVPGVPGFNGVGWRGYDWLGFQQSVRSVEALEESGANVGLLGTNFPGLDIDGSSAAFTSVVQAKAEELLGHAPMRTSREPRKLLVYRTDKSFGHMALTVEHNGVEHTVEILGKGRQYLIHGTHPSGVEYGWEERPLWYYNLDELNYITREKVTEFFDELEVHFISKGLTVTRTGDGREPAESAPPQESLQAPNPDTLTSLVSSISNSFPDRDDYIRVGHAIKAAGGDVGLFLDWAERWEDGHNAPEVVQADWDRMHPPFRVGWDWLVELAEEDGYVATCDESEADMTLKPPEVTTTSEPMVPLSDEWVVSKILPTVKQDLRYVPLTNSNGEWYVWDEHYWRKDGTLSHETLVRQTLTDFSVHDLEGKAVPGKEGNPLRLAAKRYQSADGISSVIRLLRAKMVASVVDFDTDPMILNTPTGIIDLKTGGVHPADPKRLLSRSTACGPETGPKPLWDAFLDDLTCKDAALRAFIQKAMGYALTGDTSEKSLWFIWGSNSDTGKSTFINVMDLLFGTYADSVDVSVFVSKKRDQHQPSLARLPGVRLVTATEPAAGQAWDEKRVKAITGGDKIEARALYAMPIVYRPQFKIAIVGNHEPEINNVDDAMLRRIQIIPFNEKVPRDEQIENLAQRIVDEEGPAVLAWLIEGCLLWQEEGLTPPEVVRKRTTEYAEEEDFLTHWILDECETGTECSASRQELYHAWSVWSRARGEDPQGEKAFKRALDLKKSEFGLTETQIGERRLRGYKGICLRTGVENGTEFDI